MEPGARKLKLLAESILDAWVTDYLEAEKNNESKKMQELVDWAKKGESGLWAKISKDGRLGSISAKCDTKEISGNE